jgi:hypothetical protein
MGASQSTFDKAALQDSYKEHLTQLGLLEREYKFDSKTKQLEIDPRTGGPRVKRFRLTALGRLLLREVDLVENYRNL